MKAETMLRRMPSPARMTSEEVSQGLGWFSIGLGALELMMGRALANALGMPRQSWLIRAYGVREIAKGAGILSSAPRKREPWLWARVAGDALDLATLAANLPGNRKKGNVLMALANVGMITWFDYCTAQDLRMKNRRALAMPRDYSDRSGFRRPASEMRGVARDYRERQQRTASSIHAR